MKKGIYELNKEKVINWYIKGKSGFWIQKRLDTKNKKIYDYLRKWKIEVRTISEALKGRRQTKKEIVNRIDSRKENKGWDVKPANDANRLKRKGKSYEEIYGKEKAEKIKLKISGKNSIFYLNGNGKGKYPKEFSESLKNKIRKRDNFACQECGKLQKELLRALDVHHIDFDKNNNEEYNLISLCRQCHNKTILRYYISYWIKYYQQKMGVIKIAC